LHEAIDWNKIISVASSINGRPFYGTIWFSLLATIAVVLVIWLVAVSRPYLEGRPVRAAGQFGVVLVAAYWVFVFPRLRKSRTGENKPEPDPSQRGKVVK
jgi:hypothetical protein